MAELLNHCYAVARSISDTRTTHFAESIHNRLVFVTQSEDGIRTSGIKRLWEILLILMTFLLTLATVIFLTPPVQKGHTGSRYKQLRRKHVSQHNDNTTPEEGQGKLIFLRDMGVVGNGRTGQE